MAEEAKAAELTRFRIDGNIHGTDGKSIYLHDGGYLVDGLCDAEAAALSGLDDQPVTVEVRVFARDGEGENG
ncbi:MAG: hypothetical protein R3337_00250 [Gammaproteobacteria bacterium]|nr:hypothetical protein [Gammaproteobacteria bacterium]